MSTIVLGILTLSCLPLTVLGEAGMLYRVDVTIPTQEGRNETDVDASIGDILNQMKSYGINANFALKTLDIQKYILVLEVQDMCNWHHLTTPLSNLGYKLSVTSLERCEDYALRYNVSVTFTPREDVKNHSLIWIGEALIDDEGRKGDEYVGMIKKHFEQDRVFLAKHLGEVRCYTTRMDIPVRIEGGLCGGSKKDLPFLKFQTSNSVTTCDASTMDSVSNDWKCKETRRSS